MAVALETIPGALQDAFMNSRCQRINLYETIDKSAATLVIQQLEAACKHCDRRGTSIVFLFIDSNGGSLYEALRIADAIQRARRYLTVATVIESTCFSAAVPIFLAGDPGYRFVAPDATVMIHPAVFKELQHCATTLPGNNNSVVRTPAQLSLDEQHLQRMQRRVDHALSTAQYTQAQQQQFIADYQKHCNAEWFLTADDMVRYGLADHAEIPEFVHEVTYRAKVVLPRQGTTLPVFPKRMPVRSLLPGATTPRSRSRPPSQHQPSQGRGIVLRHRNSA